MCSNFSSEQSKSPPQVITARSIIAVFRFGNSSCKSLIVFVSFVVGSVIYCSGGFAWSESILKIYKFFEKRLSPMLSSAILWYHLKSKNPILYISQTYCVVFQCRGISVIGQSPTVDGRRNDGLPWLFRNQRDDATETNPGPVTLQYPTRALLRYVIRDLGRFLPGALLRTK